MAKLNERLAQKRLSLKVSAEARNWLAKTGYDPVYGARPLRRLLHGVGLRREQLGALVAERMLAVCRLRGAEEG